MNKYHFRYTEVHINWLKENYGTKPLREITKEFNQLFGTNIGERTLIQYVSKHKIPHTLSCKQYYKYPEEIRTWLRENIQNFGSYNELTKKLNNIFNTDHTPERIKDLCTKRLKIRMNNNITRYGNKQKEEYPIGTIKTASNGTTYIKIQLTNGKKLDKRNHGYQEPYWMPLQKYIYEKEYGKINKDEFIIFLDGNNQNYELNNLACITKPISAILNKFHYYGYGHATKAMIETLKTQKELSTLERNIYEFKRT